MMYKIHTSYSLNVRTNDGSSGQIEGSRDKNMKYQRFSVQLCGLKRFVIHIIRLDFIKCRLTINSEFF